MLRTAECDGEMSDVTPFQRALQNFFKEKRVPPETQFANAFWSVPGTCPVSVGNGLLPPRCRSMSSTLLVRSFLTEASGNVVLAHVRKVFRTI